MLPSTVFAARAVWENGHLDISASGIFADGFSFCVAQNTLERFRTRPLRFEFLFYDRGLKRYDPLSVSDFTLDGQRFATGDAAFLKRFRRLCREYLEYIDIKLNTDESCLTQALTGKDFGEEYSKSYAEWLSKMGGTRAEGEILPCEAAVALDEPAKWNAPVPDTLRGIKLTHVYIGSEVCPRLFPDDEALKRLMDGPLTPVVCFPPLPERETDTYLKRAEMLPSGTELAVNDIGTALMLKGRGFKLTRGMCFERGKRDPRMPEASRITEEAPFYADYLRSLGFSDTKALYLPLYRVNTSLLCPLKALCETGSRGEQRYAPDCRIWCGERAVFYPDGMKLIGRFNSLFGYDDTINDPARVNAALENGVTRLVINA